MAKKIIKKPHKEEQHKVRAIDLEPLMKELQTIKDQQKLLEARAVKIKDKLKDYVEQIGIKDAKGSLLVRVGDKVAKNEARKKVKINAERAEELFKKLGIWDEMIDTKEIINPDYVERAFINEQLSKKQLESISDIDTTFAFVTYDYKPDEDGEGLL